MPHVNEWTQLLGEDMLDWFDGVCEEIKASFGWPPLGRAELSASGVRGREKADAAVLADLLVRLGPERAMTIMNAAGGELAEAFGARVVGEAMSEAKAAFTRERGMDGRETYAEPEGGGG